MNVVFAAGGTGGHIIPALAVADALRELCPAVQIHFVGAGSPMESQLIAPRYPLHTVRFVPVLGKGVSGLFSMLGRFPSALKEAISLFKELQPRFVFSFGGFPSFIPAVAAAWLRIPRLLHEQNAKVGLANKCLGLIVQRIYAVPGAKGFVLRSPHGFVANPVRKEFYEISGWSSASTQKQFCLLVLGGSQGAKTLNTAVIRLAKELALPNLEIIHVAGERNYEQLSQEYTEAGLDPSGVFGFSSEPWKLIERAQLIISRAGAMSAAEFCAAARPVVYVPLPIASAHQSQNIAHQVLAGAAREVAQDEHLPTKLRETVGGLIHSSVALKEMVDKMRTLRGEGSQSPAKFLAEQALKLAGLDQCPQ
jgi:UDP-N-acetylglucosamine--N-acetylmuramyl-(pentapeptide) pyrophosphoryl-undecaprenol N-acetylglucosamine transferase